jgi:hypothetical protein
MEVLGKVHAMASPCGFGDGQKVLCTQIANASSLGRLERREYRAVQHMDLGELREVSARCPEEMGDEYVSGADGN